MARDLHDILGHSLTVITVKAELAGRLAERRGADRARAEIADVERLAREALADVRATVGGMREVTLAGELAGARTALEAAGHRRRAAVRRVDDVPPRGVSCSPGRCARASPTWSGTAGPSAAWSG